jgi:hypothetical protein
MSTMRQRRQAGRHPSRHRAAPRRRVRQLDRRSADAGIHPGGERRAPHDVIHHDDDKREYAYGPKSRVGTFSDALMVETKKRHWNVISMKNDWKRIFAFENK